MRCPLVREGACSAPALSASASVRARTRSAGSSSAYASWKSETTGAVSVVKAQLRVVPSDLPSARSALAPTLTT